MKRATSAKQFGFSARHTPIWFHSLGMASVADGTVLQAVASSQSLNFFLKASVFVAEQFCQLVFCLWNSGRSDHLSFQYSIPFSLRWQGLLV